MRSREVYSPSEVFMADANVREPFAEQGLSATESRVFRTKRKGARASGDDKRPAKNASSGSVQRFEDWEFRKACW